MSYMSRTGATGIRLFFTGREANGVKKPPPLVLPTHGYF